MTTGLGSSAATQPEISYWRRAVVDVSVEV
jgi:hypothetical protein